MSERISDAARWGIEQGYHDVFGNWHAVTDETVARLVAALSRGHDVNPDRPGADNGGGGTETARAFQGNGRRVWGIAIQLYALRSRHNWGHGDFGDLRRLIEIAAKRGAAAIGLNPLHALFRDRAERASPYGPNSRLFLNVLYIDVAGVPEFQGTDFSSLAARIAALRASELIDYRGVSTVKLAALRLAHARFRVQATAERRADFESFRAERGEALLRFSCFEALRQRFGSKPWTEWPRPWNDPDVKTLQAFRVASENEDECDFHEFLQWTAHRQLDACKQVARELGMSIGLYTDLAVGIDRHGADAWSEQQTIMADLSVGAPPDEFNPKGQDWGLAPHNPLTMAQNDFAPLRRLMRAVMRHAGAVRIDHVLGLNRMFLIPAGAGAANGAYVRYPFEAALRVIAEESNAARCIVIGEDLGTVPDGFRDTIMRWGLWSYRVLLFEREGDGRFRPPEAYPEQALATFNTHDLPTFRGWMTGHDLRTKHEIGFDPGESVEARTWWQGSLRALLSERGGGRSADDFAAVAAVLGATPSRLVMVGLEDVLGVVDQVNIPGTIGEHPNWRRKLPVDVEDLDGNQALGDVAAAFAQAGRSDS
ncbi:MAG: 4-alpha-glucanotransferase [Pseudolabrys sp.]|jgi:4-alpha-glucanotransferase